VTLEAMKMETAVRSDRDGTIDEVLVRTGNTVEAKDLLLTFRQAPRPARDRYSRAAIFFSIDSGVSSARSAPRRCPGGRRGTS